MSHLNLSNFYKILMKPSQHLRIGVFKRKGGSLCRRKYKLNVHKKLLTQLIIKKSMRWWKGTKEEI